jgi:hypothetical protein
MYGSFFPMAKEITLWNTLDMSVWESAKSANLRPSAKTPLAPTKG